jgi:hypothetical protein
MLKYNYCFYVGTNFFLLFIIILKDESAIVRHILTHGVSVRILQCSIIILNRVSLAV